MAYQEKDFQKEFGKMNKLGGVFELKITKKKSFIFDWVKPHQIRALTRASSDVGCYHKISDYSPNAKPFDCFNIVNTNAYVVVMFYEPRKNKSVYYIPIDEFLALQVITLPKKSIKEEDLAKNCNISSNYLKKKLTNHVNMI